MTSEDVQTGEVPTVHLIVRLELPDRPRKEYSYDFAQPQIVLGRDPGCDIQIPLTTVSRRHAQILCERKDFFLEDLGSTHGTVHNGTRLDPREKRLLRDGDQVDIMSFSVTFKSQQELLDRQPGEKTEALARRMVQEVLSSLGDNEVDPPALRIMNGPNEGQRYEIREDQAELVLGRSPECDLVLDDQNASRRHCLIKRTWNGFTAKDLGSKNGVVINGQVAHEAAALRDGDELQVGGVKLTFIDPAARIMDRFGGFSEETAFPEESSPHLMGEEGSEGSDEEAYAEDELDPDSAEEFPAEEDAEQQEGFEESFHPELDPMNPPPADPAVDPGMESFNAPPVGGIGLEVAVLVFGGICLLVTLAFVVMMLV